MSQDFAPTISTDSFEVTVVANTPVTITHGLGRQIEGWLVIWQTAPVSLSVVDAAADTRQTLVLLPDQSANIRLVLL